MESLIYWRDVKKSGIVFGAGLVLLLAISVCSVISVFAYTSLIALVSAISFRIYKNVLQAVQKTPEGHPFADYLSVELALPQEKVQELAAVSVAHVNALVVELRRLFLVEDLIDSIKFGLLLWGLTYLGSWFNGMTLVILGEYSKLVAPFGEINAVLTICLFRLHAQPSSLCSRSPRSTRTTSRTLTPIWVWCAAKSRRSLRSECGQSSANDCFNIYILIMFFSPVYLLQDQGFRSVRQQGHRRRCDH